MMEFVGVVRTWIPTTSGERLLFLLLRHHREWQTLSTALSGAGLGLGRRFVGLADFFLGASVQHLQQRLIKLAHDIREVHPMDRSRQLVELRTRAGEVLDFTPMGYDGDFGEVIEEILTSAEQMPKRPRPGLRRAVVRNVPRTCYSCGRSFGVASKDAPDGLKPTADHLWPRALGGDTIEANLLPACHSCNVSKGHLAAWQMAWIQPVVFADCDEEHGLKSLQRDLQMALHMRAAMAYATANGTTLRDAFLAIGPREAPVRCDADQGYDFFNLRVHDETRTGIAWIPT